jgi:prepilin-type processing-associated H-X9-DG protein
VTDLAGLKDSELCKPASMYMTDGGTEPLNTIDPLKYVTTKSPEKAGCRIVHDPVNDAPCSGCVTSSGYPNWGGPQLRHEGRSNVAFVDGHIQPVKASQWYWAGTPWLKVAIGGD